MKKLLAIMPALIMALAMVPALAAEWDIDKGDITVNAGSGAQTVTQGDGAAVEDSAPVITGSSTENTLTINADNDKTAKVTLSGVNIDVSNSGKAAVSTGGDGDVIIVLKGKNTVKSGQDRAGVEKGNAGNLTIADDGNDGSLEATGGNSGAGIGGGLMNGSGSGITISGGEVKATGGQLGAGIGGGAKGFSSDITISGGTVKATSDHAGAGIGGGWNGKSGKVTFSGKVKATVQGGVGDRNYGAGAGIGDGGSFSNGNPVDGDDLHRTNSNLLNVSGLEPGAIIRCYKQGTVIPDSLLYEIPELPDGEVVNVKCKTNSDHAEKTYQLIAGSYDVGNVEGDATDGYTCTITVYPVKYVAEYNKTHGDHALDPNPQSGSITFKWENAEWTLLAGQNLPITFTVVHDTQESPNPSPSTDPNPNPTPGGGNGGGYFYPTTTPVPVIVIPPKTGDMTVWQSILHFLGIR